MSKDELPFMDLLTCGSFSRPSTVRKDCFTITDNQAACTSSGDTAENKRSSSAETSCVVEGQSHQTCSSSSTYDCSLRSDPSSPKERDYIGSGCPFSTPSDPRSKRAENCSLGSLHDEVTSLHSRLTLRGTDLKLAPPGDIFESPVEVLRAVDSGSHKSLESVTQTSMLKGRKRRRPEVKSSVQNCPPPVPSAGAPFSSFSREERDSVNHTQQAAQEEMPPPQGTDVVGWPPVNSYRKSSTHPPDYAKAFEQNECPCVTSTVEEDASAADPACLIYSSRIKVSMDGVPFMRKLDLSKINGYRDLFLEVENLFQMLAAMSDAAAAQRMNSLQIDRRLRADLHWPHHVLTYEDREGDWMLAGDTPWGIFCRSAKRIRIMKR